jgi:hypothetical protein
MINYVNVCKIVLEEITSHNFFINKEKADMHIHISFISAHNYTFKLTHAYYFTISFLRHSLRMAFTGFSLAALTD